MVWVFCIFFIHWTFGLFVPFGNYEQFFEGHVFISLGNISRCKIAGSYSNSVFDHLRIPKFLLIIKQYNMLYNI